MQLRFVKVKTLLNYAFIDYQHVNQWHSRYTHCLHIMSFLQFFEISLTSLEHVFYACSVRELSEH